MQVATVWLAVGADADVAEPCEDRAHACHVRVGRDDLGLCREGPAVGPPTLALESDGDGLAGAKVASLSEGGADQQVAVSECVGHWDGVATP